MILSANRYSSPDHARREYAMLIVCPTCSTTYQIQLAALGAAGRSVRCSHCKNTWFATPESVIEEVALPHASGSGAAGPVRPSAAVRASRTTSTRRRRAISRSKPRCRRRPPRGPKSRWPKWMRPRSLRGDQVERNVRGEIRSRRVRGHRDHRGAARAPSLRGTQGQADRAAAHCQPAGADRRSGGDPHRCGARARDRRAAFSADRLAVLHARDAGEPARPDLSGRQEQGRIP